MTKQDLKEMKKLLKKRKESELKIEEIQNKLDEELRIEEEQLKIKEEKKARKIKEEKEAIETIPQQEEEIINAPNTETIPAYPLKKHFRTKGSKFSWKYWKEWYIDKYFPERTVLINLELSNGFFKRFLVLEKDGGFKYRGKKFLLDNETKYYCIDDKLWCYDFHEECSLPININNKVPSKELRDQTIKDFSEVGISIKRHMPVNEIKKIIESSGLTEVEYAINPATLERFETAKIAEGIMKGQAIDEFLRRLNIMVIVLLIIGLIHFALFIKASGILESINLSF